MTNNILALGADSELRNALFNTLGLQKDYQFLFCDSFAGLDQMLPEIRERVSIVLMEVSHLPAGTSLIGIADIKSLCPASQVILLSQWADETLWIEAIQQGAYDVLRKPLDSQEFRRVVYNAVKASSSHRIGCNPVPSISGVTGVELFSQN